MAGNGLRTWWR